MSKQESSFLDRDRRPPHRGCRRPGRPGGALRLAPRFAAGKVIRISTPGPDTEWQSKALAGFKEELDKAMPGAFDVQIHYNGTLFAQGTEIEAMQRGNLEVALTSPADIAELIPEYSIFTTGYLMRDAAHLDAVYDGDIGKEYKDKVASDSRSAYRAQPVSRHAPRHPARSRAT